MKIAVDAQYIKDRENTGTEKYLLNLLNNLSLIDKDNVYHIYYRNQLSANTLAFMSNSNSNFHFYRIDKGHFWTQFGCHCI